MANIPFNKPFIVGKELFYIAKAVLGGHLSGDGYYSAKCHHWLEEKLATPKALLTHSCTAALEMAAILCDIRPGDEIIMPSFTFVSTANAFVLRGGVPVFIDIKPDSLNMDTGLIAPAVSPKTKVILPVHYAGNPCAMDHIMEIAEAKKLWVVEDAAQALLSRYKTRALGTIGDFGALSFHETKNIIAGEGGALLVNRPDMVERAEIIREKGTNRKKFFRGEVDKYSWVDIGSSFLPSELTAAFLWAQFEEAEKIIQKRRKLCRRYQKGLAEGRDNGDLSFFSTTADGIDNGHMLYILANSFQERSDLIQHLKNADIHAVFHYVPLHSSTAGRAYGRISGNMIHTDNISARVLRLPLYYEMEETDVDRVCDVVMEFYRA